jgi:hypothetical protein
MLLQHAERCVEAFSVPSLLLLLLLLPAHC